MLTINYILLSVSSVTNNKEVADKYLEEKITRSLNALRFFYFFLSRGSKYFIEKLLLLYYKIINN